MAATENSSVLGLLAAVLSAERAQQAAADVGGADALEGFAAVRALAGLRGSPPQRGPETADEAPR